MVIHWAWHIQLLATLTINFGRENVMSKLFYTQESFPVRSDSAIRSVVTFRLINVSSIPAVVADKPMFNPNPPIKLCMENIQVPFCNH